MSPSETTEKPGLKELRRIFPAAEIEDNSKKGGGYTYNLTVPFREVGPDRAVLFAELGKKINAAIMKLGEELDVKNSILPPSAQGSMQFSNSVGLNAGLLEMPKIVEKLVNHDVIDISVPPKTTEEVLTHSR